LRNLRKTVGIMVLAALILAACAPSNIHFENSREPVAEAQYDVIVFGSEPEGIAAAVSAARNGMKTLLLSEDAQVGGLMILGQLNFIDMCEDREGVLLTQGIFKEFYDKVGGSAFDLEEAEHVFLTMIAEEENLSLGFEYTLQAPILENNVLKGIVVQKGENRECYYGQCLIDATADGDLAALSGVPYTFAGEDIGEEDRQMGVTLIFELSDVKWSKVFAYLNWDRLKAKVSGGTSEGGATLKMAWGYTDEGYAYVPHDEMMRLRGFNIARQDNGNVLINALIIFGVDVLDEESKAEGIARGQQEMEYLLPYIRENFVGFEQAKLVSTASRLYIRESRHMIGEDQLTIDDVLENRDQWDKIAIGSYPVDVQPTVTQTYGTVIGSPDKYAIPYGCIVPKVVDHLLVVGRSASYTSLAAGSARVIPLGMACGEAAGVAAAYAVDKDITVRDICENKEAIGQIQQRLKEQGAYLVDFRTIDPIMEHWAYNGVKTLRGIGLLDGGYSNDYKLEETMGKWRFQTMINGIAKKTGQEEVGYLEVNEPPTNDEIVSACLKIVAQAEDLVGVNELAYEQKVRILYEREILTEALLPYYSDENANPQVAEVVMLCANVYQWVENI